MINYGIDLNLIPGGVAPRVDVSQYDHGQTITCVLWDGNTAFSLPNGSAASVTGTKPDGTGFIYACTYYQGSPVVTITEQMTAVAGEVACELVIVGDGDRQGTVNFVLDVEPAAMRSDVPISETDIPIIQQLPEIVAEVEDYAEEAHQWATYGSEGETPSATNNAKYWAGIAQTYATGALHWMGSVAFEDIPTTGMTNGDFYNITNDFTTDNRFIEGAGKECAAGTNIVYTGSLWDIVTPATTASQVKFDNTGTGMSATNTQDAIEEVNSNLTNLANIEVVEAHLDLASQSVAPNTLVQQEFSDGGMSGYTNIGYIVDVDDAVIATVCKYANSRLFVNLYNPSATTVSIKAHVIALYKKA